MALVGHISGSSQTQSIIGVSGSLIIANENSSRFPSVSSIGSDVSFFVSGSRGGKGGSVRNVSVFGGDTVVSGTLTIGTGSVSITSNDITFFGGIAQVLSGSGGLTLKDSSGTVTVGQIITGITPATPTPSYWSSVTNNEIFTTGSAVVSGSVAVKNGSGATQFNVDSATGNLTLAGNVDSLTAGNKTIFASAGANNVTIGGASSTVVVPGNLTVQGTTTTIDTTNLVVEDPIIYFGSGSVGSNRNGGIALASGSSVTDQALVWGRVANDTWGAGRYDVTGGIANDLTGMTLTPVRASMFQVNGTVAAIKEDTGGIIISGSTVFLESSTSLTRFMQNGFNDSLRVDVSNATNPLILANAGGIANQTLVVSGTALVLDSVLGTAFKKQTATYLTVTTGSALSYPNVANITSTQTTLLGGNTVVLSGSGGNGVVSNTPATTGFTFNADGAAMLNVKSPSSNQVAIDVQGTFSTLSIGGTDTPLTTMNLGTGAETLAIGKGGSTTTFGGNVLPTGDRQYDLGSQSNRWQNIYTGDLHLRNERGDYTLIEEEDFLSIRFNKTGKRYKFVLEPVPELDEK